MKRIDYVFITSLGIIAVALVLPGSIGPCGPTSDWAVIKLLTLPVAFLGCIVGVALSVGFRLKDQFTKRRDNNEVLVDKQQ